MKVLAAGLAAVHTKLQAINVAVYLELDQPASKRNLCWSVHKKMCEGEGISSSRTTEVLAAVHKVMRPTMWLCVAKQYNHLHKEGVKQHLPHFVCVVWSQLQYFDL